MKEIILKNIPERVYKKLEKKAIGNNRTIDEEVLIQLNSINEDTSDKVKPPKIGKKYPKL